MRDIASPNLAEQLVQAVEAAAGVYPGYRTLHAKGAPALGAFTAFGGAGAITTAAHL